MSKRISLTTCFILFTFVLNACTSNSHKVSEENWPKGVPPRADFLKVYEADPVNRKIQTEEEYFTWILRFYNGWELYRRGWVKMTDELMEQVKNSAQADEIHYKINRIGKLVSGEWAKKSDTRTIYLRHVSVWGNALLESLDRHEALPLINRINKDVDDLLAHRISVDVITAERYYPRDENDPFL